MNTAVMHEGCGGQIGWFNYEDSRGLQSKHFTRMDGTHPEPGERTIEVCNKCGQRVSVMRMLRREK